MKFVQVLLKIVIFFTVIYKQVNVNPTIYVFDTPGILEPSFKDIETGFKLTCLSNDEIAFRNNKLMRLFLKFRFNQKLSRECYFIM